MLDSTLPDADIYIMAVADSAITQVAKKIGGLRGIFCHTSGAAGIESLPEINRRGVLYPLQTLSKQRQVDFAHVPLCIEATNQEDLGLLRQLGESLSNTVLEVNSQQRIHLHLSAVFVNNFTNHMVYLGESLCQSQSLPNGLLRPLLAETFDKLQALTPFEAQTGPARRGDRQTQETHISMLTSPALKTLYRKISESIERSYEKEL